MHNFTIYYFGREHSEPTGDCYSRKYVGSHGSVSEAMKAARVEAHVVTVRVIYQDGAKINHNH